MDVTVSSARDAKSILESVSIVKQQLVSKCFKMNGAAKHKLFEVLASKRVCKIIMDEPHSPPSVEEETRYSKRVAEFDYFTLYEHAHVDDDTVRIFARFDSNERWHSAWFGKIELK